MRRVAQIKILLILATLLLLDCGAALAEIRPGSYTISLMGGAYGFDSEQELESSPFYSIGLGHNVGKSFSFELAGQQVMTTSKVTNGDFNVWSGRLDLLYHFNPDSPAVVHFLLGGGGLFIEDLDGNTPTDTDGMINYGLGAQFFITPSIALRLDGRHIITFENSRTGGGIENFQGSAGMTFHLGGDKSAPTPVDSDYDGVIDPLDACPGTPSGAIVDARGCSADSDADGVLDLDDQCPDTSPGVAVLRDGCPPDSDHDGIPDHRDRCADTPAGAAVNRYGCPTENDTDMDGVPDSRDLCDDTPAGTPVDNSGCPLPTDQDGDGVPDGKDICSDTPAGTPVDTSGCPLTDGSVEDALSLDIRFATGTSTVDAESRKQLGQAAVFLKQYPDKRIRIEGHTDSTGSEAANLKLSQKRAEAVRTILVRDFAVSPDQVIAKGFGESRPIASNDNPEGRLINRRVVISILR